MLITNDVREKAALVLIGIRCRATTSATEPGNREVSQRQSKVFRSVAFSRMLLREDQAWSGNCQFRQNLSLGIHLRSLPVR
jgi:hypothetical protein